MAKVNYGKNPMNKTYRWMAMATVVCSALILCASGEIPLVASLGSITKPLEPPNSAVARPKSLALAGQARLGEWIQLPAPLNEEYVAADREGLEKGVRTIGMVRDLPQPYEIGQAKKSTWSVTADGTKVWSVVIESPSATGIRLGLDHVVLPAGATFRAASFTDPAQIVGPYDHQAIETQGRFWTETVFDQAVVLECQVPRDVDEKTFSVSISKIAHLYVSLDNGFLAKEGNCNNDVTCAAANWRNSGNSVAGIGSIGDNGVLWCTGTLLNNSAEDYTDYFLTANHCIANQAEASTTEYYWFYQTSTCNGTPPNPASVPRTGLGADYLQGRSSAQANDFAFLLLRQATPAGVTYSGWTTNHPGNLATVTGIHHPDGSYKRISYGALTEESLFFWSMRWSSGVTEPGSSGSPLFNSSRQVIGQLYGGYSSCDFPSGIDEYGRFSVTYPLISKWLNPWDSGYQDLGNSWRRLSWFGDYLPMGTAGWIWHNKHKFLFVAANSVPESIWFYAQDQGWLWTSSTVYPFLYRAAPAGWLWYNGSTNPRWFRNMTTSQWETWP